MCMRKVILPALVAGCMTMAADAQTVNNNGHGHE